MVRYSPTVLHRGDVPGMATDIGALEVHHAVVSHRQRRDRPPSAPTSATMRRSCRGQKEQKREETAGASLSSLEEVSPVSDFNLPKQRRSTPLVRTDPPGCSAESGDLSAVPKASAWEDPKGFPLTSRFSAASPMNDHASSDDDVDRTHADVARLKPNAKKSEDMRVWERESLRADGSKEQFYCRRSTSCKISTDAGRGRERKERRDLILGREDTLNLRTCDSSALCSCQRFGALTGAQDLKEDPQPNLGVDRRVFLDKDCEQHKRKSGRRRPKEYRTAANLHHDYRRVHWRYNCDDRSAYRDDKYRTGRDHFHNWRDQRRMEESVDKRSGRQFNRSSYSGKCPSNDNLRQPPGTTGEPCLNGQDRWAEAEPTRLAREPNVYSRDSRRYNDFSGHPKFQSVDRSTGDYYRSGIGDVSTDYNNTYYGRKNEGYGNYYGYVPRFHYEDVYYDALYRYNPAYRKQVDAYYSRFGFSSAQQINWGNVRAGPLSTDVHLPHRQNVADSVVQDKAPQPQEVLKFPRPHPIARFCGVNGLVKLVPGVSGNKLPQLVELHSLTPLFQKDPSYRELEEFPGPLIRFETHKDNVIRFCKKKIASFAEMPDLPDRSSRILLWELLVLMLRQNGLVSGTEIAELLVRDYEMLERTPSVPCSRIMCDGDANVSSKSSGVCTSLSFDDAVVCDSDQLGTTTTSHVLAKFREYLLHGRKKCALEWAAKHGLWGHALLLASRMDVRTHASTMARFTNALSLSDPLRTLYQHLSGRHPASATLAAAGKWGDWKPHLAMILSNPSKCPEADVRSVIALGDALASHGRLWAAHFCYLVAHAEFGSYSRKSSKLVLLGANHQTLPFREFASNEAIHCTEIYEYARSLCDPSYTLPHLQVYKFLHATRLAECGFLEEALHYCEVLTKAMAHHCVSVQLAAQLYELANRLKFQIPQFIPEQTEPRKSDEDPLMDLLAQIISEHLSIVAENKVKPQTGDNGTLRFDGETDEIAVMAEILSADSGFQSQPNVRNSSDFPVSDNDRYTMRQPEDYFSSYVDTFAYKGSLISVEQSSVAETKATAEQWSPLIAESAALDASHIQAPANHAFLATPRATPFDCCQSSLPQPPTVTQASEEHDFAATCYPHRPGSLLEEKDKLPLSPPAGPEAAQFNSYSASAYSQHPGTSTSNDDIVAISNSTDTRSRQDSVDNYASSPVHKRVQSKCSTSGLARASSAARKSWLGAILEKLTPAQPNQIILPDDADPAIVWDDDRKCWVDKTAPPGETDALMAPPPTDSAFGGPSTFSSKPGQNRFHLSKQRSLRGRYVDVLNADSSRAPGNSYSLPTAASEEQPSTTQGGPQFFVPQLASEWCGNSSCDISCTPVPDPTATPLPLLSPGTSAHYWPSPMPASSPVVFSATSSSAV